MKIILKFLFKKILENKLRTILILFSIILSTALLFTTLSSAKSLGKMMTNQIIKYTGTAEIVIQKDPQVTSDLFFDLKPINIDSNITYKLPVVLGNGSFGDIPVYIGGYTVNELISIHNPTFHHISMYEFTGNQIIIGQREAMFYNVEVGDNFYLYINNTYHQFTIFGIANPTGLFDYDGNTLAVVIPKDTLATIYGHPGQYNTIFVKTSNKADTQDILSSLSKGYEDFIVKTTVTQEEIEANVANLSTMFSIMLILVVFISTFIINTSFKVITLEKLPVVGTLRSIGATKSKTNIILLGEGIIYGIIGGIIGLGLGIGILYLMLNALAFNPYTGIRMKTELVIESEFIVISFLFAFILSIICTIIPILKISKTPVRDIIFNNHKEVVKNKNFNLISGLISLIISFILINAFANADFLIGGIAIILMVIGIIQLVPTLTRGFIYLLEKIKFKNEGLIAIKNIRKSKTVRNNIALLAIGIAGIIMINTVSSKVVDEVLNIFKHSTFEIGFSTRQLDENIQKDLENIEGVEATYGFYQQNNVKIKEKNDYVLWFWGGTVEFFEYWGLPISGDKEEIFNELKQGRNIITSKILLDKYNLEIGDKIHLILNNNEVEYTIIGMSNTLMNNGNFMLIDESIFKQDTKIEYMQEIYIKTNGDPNIVGERIKEAFKDRVINLFYLDDLLQTNIEANNQIFMLLSGFSFIAMVIGTFGIFNNFVINIISRKRSLAVFRSIGMSKKQTIKMLVYESIFGGFCGGVIGIIGSLILLNAAEYIMQAMQLPLKLQLDFSTIITGILGGILVSLMASILPAIRSSKQNIIEGIKYE